MNPTPDPEAIRLLPQQAGACLALGDPRQADQRLARTSLRQLIETAIHVAHFAEKNADPDLASVAATLHQRATDYQFGYTTLAPDDRHQAVRALIAAANDLTAYWSLRS